MKEATTGFQVELPRRATLTRRIRTVVDFWHFQHTSNRSDSSPLWRIVSRSESWFPLFDSDERRLQIELLGLFVCVSGNTWKIRPERLTELAKWLFSDIRGPLRIPRLENVSKHRGQLDMKLLKSLEAARRSRAFRGEQEGNCESTMRTLEPNSHKRV